MPEGPRAIKIEPGQAASRCKLCRKVIYWGAHPATGRVHPVSVNGKLLSDARPPMSDRAGAGVSHFLDCEVYQRQQAVLREQRESQKRVIEEQQTELPLLTPSR